MIHSPYSLQDILMTRSGGLRRRFAFTLVEMMIAMALTLLLMAALGRGFAYVGETIRDSRAQVELTNELRDITNRLNNELANCTVSLQPALTGNNPSGYFFYYEGPLTDATSSLFLSDTVNGATQTTQSRYGDFDDYLAFTAVAAGDNWFTGKVPRYVLDQKTAQLLGDVYNPINFQGNPWDPVVIQSKYAEIIYFASPDYVLSALPVGINPIDFENNGLPDNIRLHRRVLLIRPDLNINGAITDRDFTINGTSFPFMRADQWSAITTATNDTVNPGTNAIWNLAWMYGMAGVHQQCDLSLRRVVDANGLPTRSVAANSLQDLAQPHNRFAHVRVPGEVVGLANTVTTMPLLALNAASPILNNVSGVNGTTLLAPPLLGTANQPVITPTLLNGFIRPEFVLGNDFTHQFSPDDVWGRERAGEDVIATNALAFDVKVFDRQARIFTTTIGQTVRASDPGYREALRDFLNRPTPRPAQLQGDYVDLMFPVLAGGPIRGWQARLFDRMAPVTGNSDSAIAFSPDTQNIFCTQFSGLRRDDTATNWRPSSTAYVESLYRSGRLIVDNDNFIRVFQPAFDTYTNHYEHDGFNQSQPTSLPGKGTRWSRTAPSGNVFDNGATGINSSATSVFGADNFLERETSPPFVTRPESIQVTVRLENPNNRQIHQMSVVHKDRQ